jgi:hypothetical protein
MNARDVAALLRRRFFETLPSSSAVRRGKVEEIQHLCFFESEIKRNRVVGEKYTPLLLIGKYREKIKKSEVPFK